MAKQWTVYKDELDEMMALLEELAIRLEKAAEEQQSVDSMAGDVTKVFISANDVLIKMRQAGDVYKDEMVRINNLLERSADAFALCPTDEQLHYGAGTELE